MAELHVAKTGNDSNPGTEGEPFLTITAAKTAATSNDTIIVHPGTYDEHNLLKNGVNYFFEDGAIVDYSGQTSSIFTDENTIGAGGAATCVIDGRGEFRIGTPGIKPTPVKRNILRLVQDGSNVKIRGKRAVSLFEHAGGINPETSTSNTIFIDARFDILEGTYDPVLVESIGDDSVITVVADTIRSLGTDPSDDAIETGIQTRGTVNIFAREITSITGYGMLTAGTNSKIRVVCGRIYSRDREAFSTNQRFRGVFGIAENSGTNPVFAATNSATGNLPRVRVGKVISHAGAAVNIGQLTIPSVDFFVRGHIVSIGEIVSSSTAPPVELSLGNHVVSIGKIVTPDGIDAFGLTADEGDRHVWFEHECLANGALPETITDETEGDGFFKQVPREELVYSVVGRLDGLLDNDFFDAIGVDNVSIGLEMAPLAIIQGIMSMSGTTGAGRLGSRIWA